jgi:hypothetical protein
MNGGVLMNDESVPNFEEVGITEELLKIFESLPPNQKTTYLDYLSSLSASQEHCLCSPVLMIQSV